ncbi:uncharacterized protein LOC134276896 isoform X2 [Saccostrea cucullata]|uniref:uncharacterized protein LOC134276896 isoform X2 n=1 Tax=Saccostrea cuccullata TaxID=36930 RepID=UPI002ED2ABA9
MRIPSIGMCQELCLEKEIMSFAVKNYICVCIQTELLHGVHSQNPKMCSYNCSTYTDRKTLYECGGPYAYNIYFSVKSFGERTKKKVSMCMALQCGDSRYLSRECSFPLQRVCKNESIALSWRKSMDECKLSEDPSYLLGNLNLSDAESECGRLNQTNLGQSWVGFAQQIYTSFNKGQSIKKETIVQCQRCKWNNCSFIDCANGEQYRCINVPIATRKPISVNFTSLYQFSSSRKVEKITEIYNKAISFAIFTKSMSLTKTTVAPSTETDTTFNLTIPFSVVIPIVVVVTVLISVILIRRKRQSRKKKNVQTGAFHKHDTNHYSIVDKARNHFQLETQMTNSNNPADIELLRSQNSYCHKEEGVYDHLRESDPRGVGNEIIYDHARFVEGGDCDYDTTQSVKKQEEKNIYDYTEIITSDAVNADQDLEFSVLTEGSA